MGKRTVPLEISKRASCGAEFVDDDVAHGEEAAVIFEGGDGDDAAVVFEGGDAVADGFGGAFGAGGEDGGADGL